MFDLLKEYSTKKIELLKMEATEKSTLAAGSVAFVVAIVFFFIIFFLLLNIGIGLLIGHYLGNYGWGVLIVSGFYLVVMIAIIVSKKSIKAAVANKIIGSLNN